MRILPIHMFGVTGHRLDVFFKPAILSFAFTQISICSSGGEVDIFAHGEKVFTDFDKNLFPHANDDFALHDMYRPVLTEYHNREHT